MSARRSFFFDSKRCLKCYACEIACQQWHEIKSGTFKLRRVSEETLGKFPDVVRTFKSEACRQCAQPGCLEACPQGAISKRTADGIVTVNLERCDGCRKCLAACAFGIPEFGEDGKMQKCDMCLERVQCGQIPVCAASCPTQALKWREA